MEGESIGGSHTKHPLCSKEANNFGGSTCVNSLAKCYASELILVTEFSLI